MSKRKNYGFSEVMRLHCKDEQALFGKLWVAISAQIKALESSLVEGEAQELGAVIQMHACTDLGLCDDVEGFLSWGLIDERLSTVCGLKLDGRFRKHEKDVKFDVVVASFMKWSWTDAADQEMMTLLCTAYEKFKQVGRGVDPSGANSSPNPSSSSSSSSTTDATFIKSTTFSPSAGRPSLLVYISKANVEINRQADEIIALRCAAHWHGKFGETVLLLQN